jgi:hypothetical protein
VSFLTLRRFLILTYFINAKRSIARGTRQVLSKNFSARKDAYYPNISPSHYSVLTNVVGLET